MTKDIIKKAKNGTYYFRANLGYHPVTGKQIQKYRSGFSTKKEAKEAYSELLLSNNTEIEIKEDEKPSMLFQQYIEDIFIPWYKTQVKERTYENRLPTVRRHFPFFYDFSVSDIEPIHVQNWQLNLSKKGYKPSYIRAVQGLFSVAMDRAIVLNLSEVNPSRIIGNVKKVKSKIDFWTKEEFEKVKSKIDFWTKEEFEKVKSKIDFWTKEEFEKVKSKIDFWTKEEFEKVKSKIDFWTKEEFEKVKSKIDFWTKEEFEKVISYIYKEDYYQHFLFISLWLLFISGMRIGEATALQWDDIDFDTGVLSIDKTLYYKNLENFSFVEPKTQASVRQIVLDKDTLNMLKQWETFQQEVVQTGYVLSYNGFPTQKYTLSYAIERFSKMAGVHRIRLHALRHSHAALLIRMEENPLIIKDRLGHEDIETTLGTYGHLYPNSFLKWRTN